MTALETRERPAEPPPARPAAPLRRPSRPGTKATSAPPASFAVNMLSLRWRAALDAAQDALQAGTACSPPALPDGEVRERGARLAQERQTVTRLLEATARDEHVALVRGLGAPSPPSAGLGLPAGVRACIFSLDALVAASDDLHFAAWAKTFDELLHRRFERASIHFAHYQRLSRRTDYAEHLHGKPRLDGVRSFLASRGITLPEGAAGDAPGAPTVNGVANRKNEVLRRLLEHEGVGASEGSSRYLEALVASSRDCAVVSASANTGEILERAGLEDLVDVRVDGETMGALGLCPAPAPDTFLAACERLGVEALEAAAFVTTPAGVAAARTAGVALVVGVEQPGAFHRLRGSGADVVAEGLEELLDRAGAR